ncbi:MAG: hypothetical protein IJD57_00060 [Candidatus Gastranaerophilales bacterium]|nr:hypothetical protein [Candidatus Gastranaerophilales bacterium]
MKKILLILLMIFLGHSAFAMYCWEEVSGTYSYESKMKDKLGASNIVKINTYIHAPTSIYKKCGHSKKSGNYVNSSGYISSYYAYYYYSCTEEQFFTNTRYALDTTENFELSGVITNSSTAQGPQGISLFGMNTKRLYTYAYYYGTSSPYESSTPTRSSSSQNGMNNAVNEDYNTYYTNHNYFELYDPYYVHTFCTTAGGGGGGGAAGAAVNYIIKAD